MTLYSQSEVFAVLESDLRGSKIKTFDDDGFRVSGFSMFQGDAAFKVGLGFHSLELIKSGSQIGRMDYETEHGSTNFKALSGSLNYVQPGEMSAELEGEVELLQVWIDDHVFRDVAADLFKGDPDNARTLGFNGVFDPTLKQAISLIEQEFASPFDGGRLMIDAAAQQIAVALLRRSRTRQEREQSGSKRILSDVELARAMAFIEDQIEENKGLEALAREVGMSMYWFSHAFKATVGVSPHQFLIRRRVERAKTMLAESKESIAGVAYACGFSGQSHLTNIFKKHVGTSPAKYRKSVHE